MNQDKTKLTAMEALNLLAIASKLNCATTTEEKARLQKLYNKTVNNYLQKDKQNGIN
jgi:hypothetical protein